MESRRFDALARFVAARSTRRGVLRGAGGAALGALFGVRPPAGTGAATCRQGGATCLKDAQCCAGTCDPATHRCACLARQVPCGGRCCAAGQTCQSGTCVSTCTPVNQPCDTAHPEACCSGACLDTGVCACFSLAGGALPCPGGCRCDQVSPGAVGACVADVACPPGGACAGNAACGPGALCDESCFGACVPSCGCTPANQPCDAAHPEACCSGACLDTGVCACFSHATGRAVGCPSGCRCDQVNPGGVGGCVADVTCPAGGSCSSNAACGPGALCDESCFGACVAACGA